MHSAERSAGQSVVRLDAGGGPPIAYRDSAPAAGPDVPVTVLIHGLSADSRSWRPIVDALIADGYRVIAPDMRGHGLTGPAERYRVEDFVDDLVVLVDTVVPDRPVDLVGHSFGGLVAGAAAASGRISVRRVILEDTPLPPRWDGPTELPALRRRDMVVHGVMFFLRNPRSARRLDRRLVPEVRTAIQARNPDWWKAMAELSIPVLVIDGGPTGMMDRGRLADLSLAVTDLRIVTIPVGHVVHRSQPDRFAAELRAFRS